MSSRGQLGGLSAAAPAVVDLLSTLGFDLVLVETVGVGQNEVDVMRLADTVVVVLAPGMGDGVQAAKAGILEVADLLIVNKADREGAEITVRELRGMLALGRAGTAAPGQWRVPVLSLVATDGTGMTELLRRSTPTRSISSSAARTGRAVDAEPGSAVRAALLETVDRAVRPRRTASRRCSGPPPGWLTASRTIVVRRPTWRPGWGGSWPGTAMKMVAGSCRSVGRVGDSGPP